MAPEKKIFEIPDYEDAPFTDEELFRFRIGETDCALIRADYLTPERVDGVDQSDVPAIMRAVAADEAPAGGQQAAAQALPAAGLSGHGKPPLVVPASRCPGP